MVCVHTLLRQRQHCRRMPSKPGSSPTGRAWGNNSMQDITPHTHVSGCIAAPRPPATNCARQLHAPPADSAMRYTATARAKPLAHTLAPHREFYLVLSLSAPDAQQAGGGEPWQGLAPDINSFVETCIIRRTAWLSASPRRPQHYEPMNYLMQRRGISCRTRAVLRGRTYEQRRITAFTSRAVNARA